MLIFLTSQEYFTQEKAYQLRIAIVVFRHSGAFLEFRVISMEDNEDGHKDGQIHGFCRFWPSSSVNIGLNFNNLYIFELIRK